MEIIAHVRKRDMEIQSNAGHSAGVADLAESFASEFGFGLWGRAMGLLHDKGKEKNDFQKYIKTASGLVDKPLHWDDKTHAYVGALIAKKIYGPLSELMINQIAGHHAGLYDYMDLNDVMQKEIPADVDCNIERLNLDLNSLKRVTGPEEINHLWRMLYSCLVDADFLDTERFMDEESFRTRGCKTSMENLKERLDKKLKEFENFPGTSVNIIRRQVQNECLNAASLPSGFFSLTVPTGGGKTISSIVWAVNHALKNGKKRIIIAIPYTSIIVQTASVLKGIFGEENVLEHHSNNDLGTIRNDSLRHRMKLATENWDYPIVVTTNVQLFESIYSHKPSACRKLHNICNSVLILDEVQTLPTDFLQPVVDSLKCYRHLFGVSVLFTTASQPILSGIIEGCNPRSKFQGIDSIHEIIPDGVNLHKKLERVKLDIDNNGKIYDEIAAALAKHDRVLCIVNTRRDAKELFDRLPDDGIKIHLSRMMCPAHVGRKIRELKDALNNDGNKVIRVIATQLIEAGVDIDFPVVYRQEAGLDSILQAAGRCNREGKQALCTTHVFSLSKEHPLYGSAIKDANYARLNIVGERDWFAPETMNDFFRQLYSKKETFDEKDIKQWLYKPKEMCFETAAKEFRMIDDNGVNVIVNWGDSMELVEQLKLEGVSYHLMKRLSLYSVNLTERDFLEMRRSGLIEEIIEGVYVAGGTDQYDEQVGMITVNHWMEEVLIR